MLHLKKVTIFIMACVFCIIFTNVAMADNAGKIDLNTATVDELMTLKRIGPKYAQRIVEYRKQAGPFTKPEDIVNVKGIGPKTWELNKDRIIVNSSGQ